MISIHALLAESDQPRQTRHCKKFKFLSTLSLRRATKEVAIWQILIKYFYPRSPCGERRHNRLPSIPSACISIHALLAESDLADCTKIYAVGDFYPRSPCGERLWFDKWRTNEDQFLSTLSLRRATHYGWSWYDDFTISIHALLAESDPRS